MPWLQAMMKMVEADDDAADARGSLSMVEALSLMRTSCRGAGASKIEEDVAEALVLIPIV